MLLAIPSSFELPIKSVYSKRELSAFFGPDIGAIISVTDGDVGDIEKLHAVVAVYCGYVAITAAGVAVFDTVAGDDNNGCGTENNGCDDNARCNENDTCDDNAGCATNDDCNENSACTGNTGCDSGLFGENSSCVDNTECTDNGGCSDNVDCDDNTGGCMNNTSCDDLAACTNGEPA